MNTLNLTKKEEAILEEALRYYAEYFGFDLYLDEFTLGETLQAECQSFLSLIDKLGIKI